MPNSNKQLQRTLEKSKSILFFTLNQEMIIKSYNQKFRKLFDLPNCSDLLNPYTFSELINADKNNILIENIQQFLLDKEIPIQLVLKHPKNDFELEINKIEGCSGHHSEWMIIGHQIDNLEILESSENNSSINETDLFDLAGDGIIIGNHQAEIIKANQKAYEMTGYQASELLGHHISFLFDQHQLEKNPLLFHKVNKGEDVKKERLINRKNQEPLTIEMVSNKTNKGYISIMRDIQDRKNAENTLKELKNRLLFVTQMDRIGIIDINTSTLNIRFNDEMKEIFEKSTKENNKLEDWLNLIHPEDVTKINQGFDELRKTGKVFEFIYRLRSVGDKYKTIKASANLSNFDSKSESLIVSSIDITNSNWIKSRLEESEQTFKALTNAATAAIFIYSHKYLYTNHSFEKITGYSFAEVKNKAFWFLVSPEHIEVVRNRGLNRLENSSPSDSYEFKIITKSGIEKWVEFAASPINYMGEPAAIGSAFDITERKNLEIELKTNIDKLTIERQKVIYSEKQFRDYLEQNSAAMLAIEPITKNITFANYAAAKLYKYNRQELMEMKIYDINTLSKAELDEKINSVSVIESEEHSFVHRTKYGSEINVHINQSFIISNQEPSLLQIIHDISEEVTNKNKLIESHNTYRNILASISEMIYILDEDGNFKYVNDSAIKTYGYEFSYFIGKSPAFLSAPGMNDLNMVQNAIEKAFNGEQNTISFWGLRKNKTIFPKEVVLSPGQFFGEKVTIAVSRDVSEHIKITNELTEAKNKAEENDKLKSSFLANMSHEIRTPMNAILGFSELVKDPSTDENERTQFLNIINKSSHHLLHLINDIVDISKIHANQLKINHNQCHLNALLHEKYISFRSDLDLLKNKDIKLELQFGLTNENDLVITDTNRLEQILNNIIGNSIKFTHKGKITICYELIDQEIIFSVTDTGIGIDQKQREIIFERFMQADTSIGREFGGTGLGLAISKACTELLGGEIWLESELGIGTKMSFSIPYITK
ncbi:PAS domain S-box protein [Lentimicrobium sp. S6]|uniref:PAS domain-containing sensor histidine kinase n=1 Tax=Lentimicrobium sp. S6 TaxID=2735872 RepID=UPI001554F02D|nr:PAS domain S-box protein [Lentimicrobium sp. S6]NPD46613.1 PAS domain S-box protein [Lentimicrobium sp. S6]